MLRGKLPPLSITLILLFGLFLPTLSWITIIPTSSRIRKPSPRIPTKLAVQSFSLELLSDHEQVGTELAGSLQRFLDSEWMPQETHYKMGQLCKQSYIACRSEGEHDLMAVMCAIADDLEKNWEQYDADAFVNPWDCANYISDFLTMKTGVEGCECSSQIH